MTIKLESITQTFQEQLFDLSSQRREEHYQTVGVSAEYERAREKHSSLLSKLSALLGPEQGQLIEDLVSAEGDYLSLEAHRCYTAGLLDGLGDGLELKKIIDGGSVANQGSVCRLHCPGCR